MQNGLEQGKALSLPFNFALEYAIRKIQKIRRDLDWMGHISFWSMLMILIQWA